MAELLLVHHAHDKPPEYDESAATLLKQRVLGFLDAIDKRREPSAE
jgi:hypothetical protein